MANNIKIPFKKINRDALLGMLIGVPLAIILSLAINYKNPEKALPPIIGAVVCIFLFWPAQILAYKFSSSYRERATTFEKFYSSLGRWQKVKLCSELFILLLVGGSLALQGFSILVIILLFAIKYHRYMLELKKIFWIFRFAHMDSPSHQLAFLVASLILGIYCLYLAKKLLQGNTKSQ